MESVTLKESNSNLKTFPEILKGFQIGAAKYGIIYVVSMERSSLWHLYAEMIT